MTNVVRVTRVTGNNFHSTSFHFNTQNEIKTESTHKFHLNLTSYTSLILV